MCTVNLAVRVRADPPILAAADATIIVQAYRAIGTDANGTGASVLFGKRTVITVKDGVASGPIDLAATDGTFCYRWEIIFADGSAPLVRFTLVPDQTAADFWDLEDVDPLSFQPTPEVLAAWQLAAAATLQSQQSAATSAGAAHDDRVLAEGARLAAEKAAQAGGFVLSPTADVSGVLNLSALDRNTIAHRRLVGNVTGITTPDQAYPGQIVTLVLTQDATGGRTLTFPAAILTHEGVDPVLSTTAAAVDVIHLWFDGVRWWGFVAAQRGA